jgi:hypothetical protein
MVWISLLGCGVRFVPLRAFLVSSLKVSLVKLSKLHKKLSPIKIGNSFYILAYARTHSKFGSQKFFTKEFIPILYSFHLSLSLISSLPPWHHAKDNKSEIF